MKIAKLLKLLNEKRVKNKTVGTHEGVIISFSSLSDLIK